MRELLGRLFQLQSFRYVFIGGVSYVIELSALLSLAELFSLSPAIAVAGSFWVGLAVSFLLQKFIAFKSTASDRKTFSRQAVLYGLLVAFNYIFTIIFVGILSDLLGLIIARTAALLLTVGWNYTLYKRIFR